MKLPASSPGIYKLSFDAIFIDSFDNEAFWVEVNGLPISEPSRHPGFNPLWIKYYQHTTSAKVGDQVCFDGPGDCRSHECGNGVFTEHKTRVVVDNIVTHGFPQPNGLDVRFTTNLDEVRTNEAFAVDNVQVEEYNTDLLSFSNFDTGNMNGWSCGQIT